MSTATDTILPRADTPDTPPKAGRRELIGLGMQALVALRNVRMDPDVGDADESPCLGA